MMENIQELLEKSKEFFNLKDFQGCERVLNEALAHCATFNEKVYSTRSLIIRNLSFVLVKMQEPERALELLNELVDIDAENAANFRRRAELMIAHDNFDQAAEDLQTAKRLAKRSRDYKEMVLINQESVKLEILKNQEGYWLIE